MRALRLGSVCLKRDLEMPRPEYCLNWQISLLRRYTAYINTSFSLPRKNRGKLRERERESKTLEGLIWIQMVATLTPCCFVLLICQRCSHKRLTLSRWGEGDTAVERWVWTPHGALTEQHSPKPLQAGPGNLALNITTREVLKKNPELYIYTTCSYLRSCWSELGRMMLQMAKASLASEMKNVCPNSWTMVRSRRVQKRFNRESLSLSVSQ